MHQPTPISQRKEDQNKHNQMHLKNNITGRNCNKAHGSRGRDPDLETIFLLFHWIIYTSSLLFKTEQVSKVQHLPKTMNTVQWVSNRMQIKIKKETKSSEWERSGPELGDDRINLIDRKWLTSVRAMEPNGSWFLPRCRWLDSISFNFTRLRQWKEKSEAEKLKKDSKKYDIKKKLKKEKKTYFTFQTLDFPFCRICFLWMTELPPYMTHIHAFTPTEPPGIRWFRIDSH